MSASLVLLIAVLACVFGPKTLELIGGLLAVLALLWWALPGIGAPGVATIATLAGSGALLWCLGIEWQGVREGHPIRRRGRRTWLRPAPVRSPLLACSEFAARVSEVGGDFCPDAGQAFGAEVDRTLEEVRDALEPIVYGLFINTGPGWRDRLSAARSRRRAESAPISGGEDALHDRRLLFSVIAHDWPLIEQAFVGDPSGPARRLCAIATRYAQRGPGARDAELARQAFAEICAALRRESVASVSWLVAA